MLQLFPDQAEVMDEVRAAMRRTRAVLLQSPTGSGKTAMGIDMVTSAARKNKRVIFSVPRRDLLEQTSKSFSKYKINHSFIAAAKDYNPFANVYIGMVDTMARRLDRLPENIDLAMFDETHFGADALGMVINKYKDIGAWVVGLSATPWKMNGQGLGIWYNEMVTGKSTRWLIDNGRLSDYRYFYGRTHEDFRKLRKKSDKDVAEFMEQQGVIIGDCVHDYRERCMGRLHIVRCTSIKHSQKTAQAFRDGGIPAEHVDGNTSDGEKHRIFMAFARREIWILTFADLLNFGFDLSQATGLDVCIESGSDMKPSDSLAGQMQFWGRMLRYKPYPAIINDHVNNYLIHGLPCSDREWTLASLTKADSEKVPPTKQCPRCFFVHAPASQCPGCGLVYEVESRGGIRQVAGSLHELDVMTERQTLINNQNPAAPVMSNEETLEYLIKKAQNEGKKNPVAWAAKELAIIMNKEYV